MGTPSRDGSPCPGEGVGDTQLPKTPRGSALASLLGAKGERGLGPPPPPWGPGTLPPPNNPPLANSQSSPPHLLLWALPLLKPGTAAVQVLRANGVGGVPHQTLEVWQPPPLHGVEGGGGLCFPQPRCWPVPAAPAADAERCRLSVQPIVLQPSGILPSLGSGGGGESGDSTELYPELGPYPG